MGKQVNFFADATDFERFLGFAEENGFQLLPHLIPEGTLPKTALPTVGAVTSDGENWRGYFLLPARLEVHDVEYVETTDKPEFCRVKNRHSPVIEVLPCATDGSKLSNGRIYFNMDRGLPHYVPTLKSYEQLARFFRKWQKTVKYKFRVGPHTAEQVAKGTISLVHFNEVLSVAD